MPPAADVDDGLVPYTNPRSESSACDSPPPVAPGEFPTAATPPLTPLDADDGRSSSAPANLVLVPGFFGAVADRKTKLPEPLIVGDASESADRWRKFADVDDGGDFSVDFVIGASSSMSCSSIEEGVLSEPLTTLSSASLEAPVDTESGRAPAAAAANIGKIGAMAAAGSGPPPRQVSKSR